MTLDWKKILVSPDESLEFAIQELDKGSRILLVANSENELLGTVTDGDIRRALIRKLGLKSSIAEIMNTNPIITKSPYSREKVLKDMSKKGILHMPIIDSDGKVSGIESLQNLIEKPNYNNPVFLMAGGFGSRLYPMTKDTPKPLLKVGGVPLLETIISQFKKAGFNKFFISLYYKSDMIQEYFGDGSSFGVTIDYVHESKPLGTAGSLGLLPENIPELPIIIMNCDLLTKVDFEHLLHFHNKQNAIATMCVREYDLQVPFGVVSVDNYSITRIEEKPVNKFFVNAGIYVLNHHLVKKIDGKTYIDMPDLLHNELEENQVSAFPIHEYWLDIGHKNEFDKANIDFLGL